MGILDDIKTPFYFTEPITTEGLIKTLEESIKESERKAKREWRDKTKARFKAKIALQRGDITEMEYAMLMKAIDK